MDVVCLALHGAHPAQLVSAVRPISTAIAVTLQIFAQHAIQVLVLLQALQLGAVRLASPGVVFWELGVYHVQLVYIAADAIRQTSVPFVRLVLALFQQVRQDAVLVETHGARQLELAV